MKKILSLILCCIIVCSLVACDNDTTDTPDASKPTINDTSTDLTDPTEPTDDNETPDIDITPPDDPYDPNENPTVPDDVIRPNGELPNSYRDLTSAEMHHYIGIVMKAIIELDVETMREYANDNSTYIIENVKEDDVYRTMWEKTIGQSIYLEDSHMLVYKDPEFIFAHWVTDTYKNGETLKSDITEYTEQDIIAIVDKYIDKAPYIMTEVDIEDDFEIDIEDGNIIIDCNECFASTEWDSLGDVSVPHPISRSAEDLARLAFGDHSHVSLGLDYIRQNNFTIWEAYITENLQQIVAAVDNAKGYNMNAEITDGTNQLTERVYQHFYKDAERVVMIQNWMDEHVMILRDMSTVWFYNPAELNNTYPYYILNDDEKAQLKDVNIYIKDGVHQHQANTDNECYPLYQIVAQMARLGAIDWLTENGPA